jgi:hypothetical protein
MTGQIITFTNPGAQNFGTTPTLAATASSGLVPTFTSSTTNVCTISSTGQLNFVSAGTCTINADQAGNATYLAAPTVSRSFTVTPVAPGAPVIGTATAGEAQATVSFTEPSYTGGASVTGYTVTSNPGNITATGTASPITVSGLTNGTAYTFTVTATNQVGKGAASAASNSVIPMTGQIITFTNPGAQNFGTTPTLAATASSGLVPTFTSSTTDVCTISSTGQLNFVTTGTCTINADQAGNTAYLAAPTVSRSFTVNPVVPEAPVVGTVTAGDAQASVTFSAPASNGGADITSYTVTAFPDGITASDNASPITISGLTNGTAYTFTVKANNAAGAGAESASSATVTPQHIALISWETPSDIVYGTALSTNQLNATADIPGTFTYVPSEGSVLNAGNEQNLTVRFTPTDANANIESSKSASINVTPAELTVTANNQTIAFGQALPALTFWYSGFVNGDDSTVLDIQPTVSTTADPNVAADYAIVLTGGSDNNYTFRYVDGTLTVSPVTKTEQASVANISLYPNPVHSTLYIESAGIIGKVTVRNLYGSAVLNKDMSTTHAEISVKELPAGCYIVTMEINGNSFIRTIVKN